MIPAPAEISTARLRLRRWRPADLAPFGAMNADPEVMRWFPQPLTRDRSDALAARADASFDDDGLGLWAAERVDTGEFTGFIGCIWQRFEAPFTPAVEVGWRLGRAHWGRGLAPEGARAAVADVFARTDLTGIVSITTVDNVNSRRVMEKIGMTRDPAEDFDHPDLPAGSPLRRHVLYRLPAPTG